MGKLVKIEDVMEYLGVSKRTVYDWVHVGYIPHVKFRKIIRFRLEDIDKWIKQRQHKGRKTYYLSSDNSSSC